MKKLFIFGLLSLQLCSYGQTHTQVKGTRVEIIVPQGFEPSDRFSGFFCEEYLASIMVTELPGPAKEVIKGFSNDRLRGQGMTLLQRQEASFGGSEGVLFSVSQKAQDATFKKWIGVFGASNATLLVTAAFPTDEEQRLSEKLRSAVLSAKVGDQPFHPTDVLTFDVAPAGGLKVAKAVGNHLLISHAGIFPVTNLSVPIMVIGASVGKKVESVGRRDFAEARIKQTATVAEISVQTSKPISIDGLQGFQTVATARDRASRGKASVLQVVLFDDDGYYLMQGIVAEEGAAAFVPDFEATARSFKRKAARKSQ